METLVRLHNYCIDEKEDRINVAHSCDVGGEEASLLNLDDKGRPIDALGHGHHFYDAPHHREDRLLAKQQTPMDLMMASIVEKKLRRPKY